MNLRWLLANVVAASTADAVLIDIRGLGLGSRYEREPQRPDVDVGALLEEIEHRSRMRDLDDSMERFREAMDDNEWEATAGHRAFVAWKLRAGPTVWRPRRRRIVNERRGVWLAKRTRRA